ncbi:MAG: PTS sugar transporter subunit IIA [Thermoanaerobaculia bacterium]
MVTTLIVTHGRMAQELLDAAQMIVGEMPRFVAVSLDWDDSVEEVTEKTRRALETVDPADEVLILTDMYGGTPFNVAAGFFQPGQVEVVTGVNLPMVVRLGCPRSKEMTLAKLADWIQEKSRASICRAGEGQPANDTLKGAPQTQTTAEAKDGAGD